MTRDDTKQILAVIDATYPNFKVENPTETINAWHFFLADYDYNKIAIALKAYVATSGSGFAPSAAELIDMANKSYQYNIETEQGAWDMVSKALRNSAYNSREEFEKLPPLVQKAVGSPAQLREWALDPNFNHSVESSNFKRQFRELAQQDIKLKRMPMEMRAMIEQSNNMMLDCNK